TGGGKWVEIPIPADPLYQHLLLTAEKKFWRCVESGESPRLFGIEPPRPRIEAVRVVDMSSSNSWAEFAALYRNTRVAYIAHERARHRAQGAWPAADRHRSNDRDRCLDGHRELAHGPPGPCLGRMDRLRLARVPACGLRGPAPDGGRPNLCPALRAFHVGGHS